jgi:hypothetical protein
MTSEPQIVGHVLISTYWQGPHNLQSFNNPRTANPDIETGCAWCDVKILVLI